MFDLEAIIRAVGRLSETDRCLIVLQRQEGLHEFLETGVKLDALISTELVLNIFEPKSPLHDGAIILSGGRIVSAGSVLPLTDSPLSSGLGTRHRAAVGMSEQTDAVVIVVSEETGTISLAVGGHLRRYLTEARLREQLQFYWRGSETR